MEDDFPFNDFVEIIKERLTNVTPLGNIASEARVFIGKSLMPTSVYNHTVFIKLYTIEKEDDYLAPKTEKYIMDLIDHVGVFKLIDCFHFSLHSKDYVAIVTPYAEVGDLSQYVYSETPILELRQTILLMQQIVSAVECLHKNNIIHHDIKPENIVLTSEGYLYFPMTKLIDFGFSKVLTREEPFCNCESKGTPGYIAPEIEYFHMKHDYPIDIYSLGKVFEQMINVTIYDNTQEATNIFIHLYELKDSMVEIDFQKRPNILEIKQVLDIYVIPNGNDLMESSFVEQYEESQQL